MGAREIVKLEHEHALAAAVGAEHGVRPDELGGVAERLGTIVARVTAEERGGAHRWRSLPSDGAMRQEVAAAVTRHRPGCKNLVVLGIGGSALGNTALQTALNSPLYNLLPAPRRPGPRLFVLDNVDPVWIGELLDLLEPELRETTFNVISKSGETAETASQFLVFWSRLEERLGRADAAQRLVVTTDPVGGALRRLAGKMRFATLPVPEGVGGRFSVLSAVGLFSAAMCGIDIDEVLAGAAAMLPATAAARLEENPAAMIAAIHFALYGRGKRLHVMMPYAQQLRDLADWYRQLWAESLGKRVDRGGAEVFAGATPIKALGATDQHSQVQLYREGPNDKVFTLLAAEKFDRDVSIPAAFGDEETLAYLASATMGQLLNTERVATEMALVQSARPCLTVRFARVSPYAVGSFIALYEAATVLMGGLLNIDPYDQPAVQLGKEYTYALMGRAGYEAQAAELRTRLGSRAPGGR
ncbi:MAG: glucose-6-phosphate isomerase [Phycisphaerae bacterium]